MEPTAMHWLQSLSQDAANMLVASLWQGLVLAACVGLCLRLMQKTSASTRFAIWTATLAILALLPFLHVPPSVSAGAAGSGSGPWLRLDASWSFAIAAMWATASLFRAGRLIANGLRLRTLWKSATPVAIDVHTSHTPSTAKGGFFPRHALLCTSTDLDRPSVIGFFSPRILIPEWLYCELTPAELAQIVLHEQEHLHRGDDWLNLLQKISLVLFPLNPGLMWVERRLCFERELACDDGVVRATRSPRAYATCLTRLAERSLDHRAAALLLGAWERRSALAQRVVRLLRRGEVLSPLQARSLTGFVVLGLFAGAIGLSRSPKLVAFSAPLQPAAAMAPSAAAYPAGETQAGEAQDAVYRSTSLSRPRLVQASLVSHPENRPTTRRKRAASARRPAAVRPAPAQVQSWIVVTSWEPSYNPSDNPAVVFTVLRYGAGQPLLPTLPDTVMQTDNGWIFIQL